MKPQCVALNKDGQTQCKNPIYTSHYDAYCATHRYVARKGDFELWLMGPRETVKDGQYLVFQIMEKSGRAKPKFAGVITTRNETNHTELETVEFEPEFRGKKLCTWSVSTALKVALDKAPTPRKWVNIYLSPEAGFKDAARKCYVRALGELGFETSTQRRVNKRGDLMMKFKKNPK